MGESVSIYMVKLESKGHIGYRRYVLASGTSAYSVSDLTFENNRSYIFFAVPHVAGNPPKIDFIIDKMNLTVASPELCNQFIDTAEEAEELWRFMKKNGDYGIAGTTVFGWSTPKEAWSVDIKVQLKQGEKKIQLGPECAVTEDREVPHRENILKEKRNREKQKEIRNREKQNEIRNREKQKEIRNREKQNEIRNREKQKEIRRESDKSIKCFVEFKPKKHVYGLEKTALSLNRPDSTDISNILGPVGEDVLYEVNVYFDRLVESEERRVRLNVNNIGVCECEMSTNSTNSTNINLRQKAEERCFEPFRSVYDYAYISVDLVTKNYDGSEDVITFWSNIIRVESKDKINTENFYRMLAFILKEDIYQESSLDTDAEGQAGGLLASSWEKNTRRTLDAYMKLLDETVSTFNRDMEWFRMSSAETVAGSTEVMSGWNARAVDRRSVDYLSRNPQFLAECGHSRGIAVKGKKYFPLRVLSSRPQRSKDTAENRALVTLLSECLKLASTVQKRFESWMPVWPERDEYDSRLRKLERERKKCQKLINIFKEQGNEAKEKAAEEKKNEIRAEIEDQLKKMEDEENAFNKRYLELYESVQSLKDSKKLPSVIQFHAVESLFWREYCNRNRRQMLSLENLLRSYSEMLTSNVDNRLSRPAFTAVFREIPQYRRVFDLIGRWLEEGNCLSENLEENNILLNVKNGAEVYEYFCLIRLRNMFKSNKFKCIKSFRYDYEALKFEESTEIGGKDRYHIDKRFKQDKNVDNTYQYKGELNGISYEAWLYYEPVISFGDINEMDLVCNYDLDSETNNRTPDYVMKFRAEGTEDWRYAILDAKFANVYNMNRLLEKTMGKYVTNLKFRTSAQEKGCRTYLCGVLQGRLSPEGGDKNSSDQIDIGNGSKVYRANFLLNATGNAKNQDDEIWSGIVEALELGMERQKAVSAI